MSESGSSGSTSGSVDPPSVPQRPNPLRASAEIGTPILRRLPTLPLLFIGMSEELLRWCPPTRLNTGVGDGATELLSSFSMSRPTLEGLLPNVCEEGSAFSDVPAVGVNVRNEDEDTVATGPLTLAGRSGWNTGRGSAGEGVSVCLCLRCKAAFRLTSGFRGDTFQSSSLHGAICCPTSVAGFDVWTEGLAESLGGTADD